MQRARLALRLTLCLLVLLPGTGGARLLWLGPRGGGTMSPLQSGSPGGRTRGQPGPTDTLRLIDGFAFQSDAPYIGKGFTASAAPGGTTSLSLSDLEVPQVAVLTLPRAQGGTIAARVHAGAAVGLRVRCSVEQATGGFSGITDCNPDNLGTFDVALGGGLGVVIHNGRGGYTLDATYTVDLRDANLNTGRIARNRPLQIGAGSLFSTI